MKYTTNNQGFAWVYGVLIAAVVIGAIVFTGMAVSKNDDAESTKKTATVQKTTTTKKVTNEAGASISLSTQRTTYTNPDYKFSVSYPNDYKSADYAIGEIPLTDPAGFEWNVNYGQQNVFNITAYKTENLDAVLTKDGCKTANEQVTLKNGSVADVYTCMEVYRTLVVKNGDNVYVIKNMSYDNNKFYDILNTLTFSE